MKMQTKKIFIIGVSVLLLVPLGLVAQGQPRMYFTPWVWLVCASPSNGRFCRPAFNSRQQSHG